MKKWVIIGAIVGSIGPLFIVLIIIMPGGLELSLHIPTFLSLGLFPLSLFPLNIDSFAINLQWLIYIGISLLNISLYALLGLLLGTIVGGISRVIRKG